MFPYLLTYGLAVRLAWHGSREFALPVRVRVHYALKSGNLAICFVGFSRDSGRRFLERSAELGTLASVFDLVSDGLNYDTAAVGRFHSMVKGILEPEAAEILLALLRQKERGALAATGLSRGCDAMRVILKHLECESRWENNGAQEMERVGILLQIVDDILDMRQDIRKGHINFMKSAAADCYLNDLLEWDYKETFRDSPYRLFLFGAIRFSRGRAARLVGAGSNPRRSTQPIRTRLPRGRWLRGAQP